MKTIKDILTENRESVISSIKFMYKVYKVEDIKPIMIDFLSYCEERSEILVEKFENSKRVKSDLKELLARMKFSESLLKSFESTDNRKWYEIAEDIADKKGLEFNTRTGNFYKL